MNIRPSCQGSSKPYAEAKAIYPAEPNHENWFCQESGNHLFSPHTDLCFYCGKSAADDRIENTKCVARPPSEPAKSLNKKTGGLTVTANDDTGYWEIHDQSGFLCKLESESTAKQLAHAFNVLPQLLGAAMTIRRLVPCGPHHSPKVNHALAGLRAAIEKAQNINLNRKEKTIKPPT